MSKAQIKQVGNHQVLSDGRIVFIIPENSATVLGVSCASVYCRRLSVAGVVESTRPVGSRSEL